MHATSTSPTLPPPQTPAVLERVDSPRLLAALAERGFQLVGPTVRDGAIIFDDIASEEDLPIGWTDDRKYRLKRRGDAALFDYAVGPHSWKKFLVPPNVSAVLPLDGRGRDRSHRLGTSGCVGCGRCITRCAVAIDITEEVRAIRESPAKTKPEPTP